MAGNNKNYYLSYGIGFGLLGGALLAVVLRLFIESLLVWAFAPGIGMLIGIIIGIKIDMSKKK